MVMFGPMQLFVFGFPGNVFTNEIIPALDEAREQGLIRMIDYIYVAKDENGSITAVEGTDLGEVEAIVLHSAIGGLLGLGAAGIEGARAGIEAGAEFSQADFGLTKEDILSVAEDIPRNTSALLIIVEHLWAKKIKEALIDADAVMVAHGMLTPEVIVEIGAGLK